MTTHAQRLREIADWLVKCAPYIGHEARVKADSLHAAADWCERVPHESHCVCLVPQAHGYSPCNCIKSEPAP